MIHSRNPMAVAVLGLPFLLVACGGGQATSPPASASPAVSGPMATKFVTPKDGATVTGNKLDVQIAFSGFRLSCAQAGKPVVEGVGHYHIELDHALVNMYCTEKASISMQNVTPGQHTLTVLPAMNNHMEVGTGKQSVTVNYQPAQALPAITAWTLAGPNIKIQSPHTGDKVSGTFAITVAISKFNPSCDLFGKANLAGYGHWHVNVDSMSGPMMGMGTMLGMACANTFQASTEGLAPGTHSFFALLVDNQHAPLMPDVFDKVDLVVQ
jgi:hypothetical protein